MSCKPVHLTGSVMMLVILQALVLWGCKSSMDTSANKQFENCGVQGAVGSNTDADGNACTDICAEINKYAANTAKTTGQSAEEIFREKKSSESSLVQSLVSAYETARLEIEDHERQTGKPYTPPVQGPVQPGETLNPDGADNFVPPSGYCRGCTKEKAESLRNEYQTQQARLSACEFSGEKAPATGPVSSGTDNQIDADRGKIIDAVKTTADYALSELCPTMTKLLFKLKDGDAEKCDHKVIESICSGAQSAASNGAAAGANHLATGDSGMTHGALTGPLANAFRDAIIGCIEIAAADQIKTLLSEGVFSGTDAVKAFSESPKVKLALAVCSASAKLAGAFVQKGPAPPRLETSCHISDAQRWNDRFASCLALADKTCEGLSGSVNYQNIIGKIDDPGGELAATIATSGIEGVCGGLQVAPVCGVLSAAVGQAMQAITTGNSDIATCLGADQLGACAGKVYSEWVLGHTTEDMMTASGTKTTVDNGNQPITSMCLCNKEYYADDAWVSGYDTKFRNDIFLDVLATQGENACTYYHDNPAKYEEGSTRGGKSVYYYYRGCERVYLVYKGALGEGRGYYGKKAPRESFQYRKTPEGTTYDGHLGTSWCLDSDC